MLGRKVGRFRGGLVVKALRFLHHATSVSRGTQKKKKFGVLVPFGVSVFGFGGSVSGLTRSEMSTTANSSVEGSKIPTCQASEREIFIANLLVRVHLIIEMSRPALRHGSLNSLFQVALYLPS